MNIIFTHNVYDRFNTLKDTIEIERKYFPNSRTIVAYNDKHPNLEIDNIEYINFSPKTHKAGCANAFLVILDEVKNEDAIIIFSHDDVSISDINTVYKHIDSIASGEYDVVLRQPLNRDNGKFFMMEAVIFSTKIIEQIDLKLFNKDNDIPRDNRQSPSPEVFLYQTLSNKDIKINNISYKHYYTNQIESKNYNIDLNTHLGFYHKMAGTQKQRGWTE